MTRLLIGLGLAGAAALGYLVFMWATDGTSC